jgi:hypothetical protein
VNIDTLVPSLYLCVETRSIKSFVCCLSHFRTWSGIICDFERPWENFWTQLWTALCDKHFPPSTGDISLWIASALSPFAHNRTLVFGSTLKHGRHFDNWNQPLNTCVRICYLDCHEAGLWCYLVLHIENQLHILQMLYFRLWPIYWLVLICWNISGECRHSVLATDGETSTFESQFFSTNTCLFFVNLPYLEIQRRDRKWGHRWECVLL